MAERLIVLIAAVLLLFPSASHPRESHSAAGCARSGVLLQGVEQDGAVRVVTGMVYDSLSLKPLAGAAVTLMRNGKPVSFARTDSGGRFQVKAAIGDSLQVTFMGYMKKVVSVGGTGNRDVPMAQKTFMLKEVKVRSLPVFGRQDTVVFDLKRYAGERDNSLKDVLKRLPGVDVDKNGKITFNGKDVTRFTIEDLDLAGGRYNRLTETLRAQDVDKAEVVEHDQPVKALQGKVFTDDVAMNIRLRPEVRDKWMVTLHIGAVVALPLDGSEPQGGGDALQIGKSRQRMYDARYDCSGLDIASGDMLLATGGTAAYGGGIRVWQWFAVPTLDAPLDEERLRFNQSYEVTVKQTAKTKAGNEQRLTIGCLHTDENQTTDNTSIYYFDGGNPITTDETDHSDMHHDRVYVDFNHNTNTDKAYGNEYFTLEWTRGEYLSRFVGNELGSVTQRIETPELHAMNTFTRLYAKERHSWQVYSNLDFHFAPMEMTVDGQAQRLKNIIYYTDNYARVTLNRKHITHRYDIGVAAEHLNLKGRNTRLTLYVRPYWQYRRASATVRLAAPVRWEMFADRGLHYLDASPSVAVTLKNGRRSEWNMGAGYGMTTGGWAGFAISGYASDYRTLVTNSGTIPRNGTFYAKASYDYKRPVTEFFVSSSVAYNYSHGNTMTDMAISGGRYTLNTVPRDWSLQGISLHALASKGFFDISLKAKLELECSLSAGSQLSCGILTDYRSCAVKVLPEIVFSPEYGTLAYRGTFSFDRITTGGMAQKGIIDWIQRLSYTHTVGKVDISLSAVHYRNELQTGQTVNTLLADAGVVWRIKKVRLSADVRNLFDKRRYTTTTYSGVMSSTYNYELRPREVVVTVQVGICQ